MDGFVVNCNGKGMVCLGFDQGIQERNSPICLVTFGWIVLLDLYCWYDPEIPVYWPFVEWKKCHPHIWTNAWGGTDQSASVSKWSIYKLATVGLTGNPIRAPSTSLLTTQFCPTKCHPVPTDLWWLQGLCLWEQRWTMW